MQFDGRAIRSESHDKRVMPMPVSPSQPLSIRAELRRVTVGGDAIEEFGFGRVKISADPGPAAGFRIRRYRQPAVPARENARLVGILEPAFTPLGRQKRPPEKSSL